jgi:hypothetical protein
MSDMEFSIPVSLPVDSDGFLRRECPHCEGVFKWHHGPANAEAEEQAEAETYYCPLCGQPAGTDSWWTQEQLAYIEGAAMPQVATAMDDQIDKLFEGLNSKHVKVKRTGHSDVPEAPTPLVEPDDMVIVASPCHAWEPVKVPESRNGPLYCLICGAAFAV